MKIAKNTLEEQWRKKLQLDESNHLIVSIIVM